MALLKYVKEDVDNIVRYHLNFSYHNTQFCWRTC